VGVGKGGDIKGSESLVRKLGSLWPLLTPVLGWWTETKEKSKITKTWM